MKFGLIPEFIGRLPVITTVSPLDRDALVQILTEPRNALVKQYKKMFDIDGVELEFTSDAIEAVADQALLRHWRSRSPRDHGGGPPPGDVRRAQRGRHRPRCRDPEVVLDNVLPTIAGGTSWSGPSVSSARRAPDPTPSGRWAGMRRAGSLPAYQSGGVNCSR